jgi:predicted amidohydrolase
MKIACFQSDVVFGDPEANANHAIECLHAAKADGVDLAVFPEAFLTGYCVDSFERASAISIEQNHTSLLALQATCDELDILCIVGFAERDGKFLHNSAALIEPNTEARYYRKTHLPELGLDKYVVPGRELPVFETRLGRIGIIICFDSRIPEATRVLALAGAQLVVLPTNWPTGADVTADHICITRAAENRIFFATCDRVGTENGFSFIGKSKIIGVTGKVLASAGSGEECIMAEIDLAEADCKRTVSITGKYETELFATRNPKLYKTISE